MARSRSFSFLIKAEDGVGYKNSLNQALKLNGRLIISTISPDAPAKCRGLPVIRYSPETLENEIGINFALIKTISEDHVTPSGIKQNFIFCRFVKRLYSRTHLKNADGGRRQGLCR